MLPPWRTGKVIKISDETYQTRRFWIQVPELEQFDFKPGQFVTLDLPIHEKTNKRWRSYSIASWPNGTNVFELIIVKLEDGAGTTYLFNEIKEGSELSLRGPQGVFTLPENIDTDIYLICTGTGIAPFRSMVHHIKKQQLPHKGLHLIFGCRTRKDLLYFDEMTALEKELPGFRYSPVLSRESWEGRTGYVHQVYLDLIRENKPKETAGDAAALKPSRFYLCGWKAMIDEAKNKITGEGYTKKDIVQEIYG
jgi:CDP-4-dehydro-6-deoxyglucose reductase